MGALKAGFKDFFSLLGGKTSYFVSIIVLFVYHIVFDKQLNCSSKPGVKPEDWPTNSQCNFYLAMPPFILFCLILWLDGDFLVLTFVYKFGRGFCIRLWLLLFKATVTGFLWVVSVFLDGDWYVCYKREELPGFNKTSTYTEGYFKHHSMVIGFGLTLVLFSFFAIFYFIRCCVKINCSGECCWSLNRVLFEDNNLIEVDKKIESYLKTDAEESAEMDFQTIKDASSKASKEEQENSEDTPL